MNNQPTKWQIRMNALVTIFCIGMFCLPICAIVFHCAAANEAERVWQEMERKEQEKTLKAIVRYNKTVIENRKIEYEDIQNDLNKLLLVQKEIEKEKLELDRKQGFDNSK